MSESKEVVEKKMAESSDVSRHPLASHSRRRVIKLGGAAIPVVTTLASQPALAWHCNTASAWGSAQLSANASTTARNAANQKTDDTWTISDWKTNNVGLGGTNPWTKLRTVYPAIKISTDAGIGENYTGGSFDYREVTVNQLFAKIPALRPIAGLTTSPNTTKVITLLQANTTDFVSHALVAQLNYLLLGANGWGVCLNTAGQLGTVIPTSLTQMSAGSYYYPASTLWSKADVVKYLEANWIAKGT